MSPSTASGILGPAPPPRELSWRKYAQVTVVYAILFGLAFRLGSFFAWIYEGSLWYPAAGLRWTLLLLTGWRFLPCIAVAEMTVISVYGVIFQNRYYDSWWVLMVAVSPLLYASARSVFVRIAHFNPKLRSTRDVAWFCAGLVAVPLAVSALGRLIYALVGLTGWENLGPSIFSFWIGDMVGLLMITPVMLLFMPKSALHFLSVPTNVFAQTPRRLSRPQAALDFLLVWLSMFALRLLTIGFEAASDRLYWYLLFMPLIWIAFRHGLSGAAIGTLAMTSGSAWLTAPPVTPEKIFDLHILVISLALTTLMMGASVSSQRSAQRRLERQFQELESRRSEMSAFVRSLSHELKNPLVTIGGYVGHLKQELEKRSKDSLPKDSLQQDSVQEDLNALQEATGKLNDLLDSFDKFARASQPPSLKYVLSLRGIALRAVARLAPEIQAKGVRVDIANDLPTAQGDPALITQVFHQLLENAIKFLGETKDPSVEIGWDQTEDEDVIFVRDNGQGIDPRYHEKVFEVFDQLDYSSPGTGAGLALTRRIVEAHGGRIWIESPGVGQGTTIFLTLS